jgi:hypothetical protein
MRTARRNMPAALGVASWGGRDEGPDAIMRGRSAPRMWVVGIITSQSCDHGSV